MQRITNEAVGAGRSHMVKLHADHDKEGELCFDSRKRLNVQQIRFLF